MRTLTQSPTARADAVVATWAVTVVFVVYTTAVCSPVPCTCRVVPSTAATVPETPGARPPPWRRAPPPAGRADVVGVGVAADPPDEPQPARASMPSAAAGDDEGGAGEVTNGGHGHSLRRASMGDSRAARLAG